MKWQKHIHRPLILGIRLCWVSLSCFIAIVTDFNLTHKCRLDQACSVKQQLQTMKMSRVRSQMSNEMHQTPNLIWHTRKKRKPEWESLAIESWNNIDAQNQNQTSLRSKVFTAEIVDKYNIMPKANRCLNR